MSRGGQSLQARDVLYGDLLPSVLRDTEPLPGTVLSEVDIDLFQLEIRTKGIEAYHYDGNNYSGGMRWLALTDRLPEQWNADKSQVSTEATNFLSVLTAKGWEQIESEPFDPVLTQENPPPVSVTARPEHPIYFRTHQMAAIEQLTNEIRNKEWGWVYLAEPKRDLEAPAGRNFAVLLDTGVDGNKRILGVVCA